MATDNNQKLWEAAVAAMQGFMSAHVPTRINGVEITSPEDYAKAAFAYANAMLAEYHRVKREK